MVSPKLRWEDPVDLNVARDALEQSPRPPLIGVTTNWLSRVIAELEDYRRQQGAEA